MSAESLLDTVERTQQVGLQLACLLDLYGYRSSSALSYLAALTVEDVGDGCIFAPSEISLSFAEDRPVAVRCLGEFVNDRSTSSPDQTVLKVGRQILDALTRQGGEYDRELFRDLTKIAYSRRHSAHRAIRFGAAIEWPADPCASLKCYFDLHSDGRELAATRLEASFARLDLQPHFQRAKEILGHRLEQGRCRGMATDLGMSPTPGIRLYTPGACWSFTELRELLVITGRSAQLELLDLFNCAVLGRLTPREPVSQLLVSLVFTSATGPEPILKLDAFLPALKPDDLASYQAFCRLADALGVSSADYASAFKTLAGADGLAGSQRMLQYVSVDFLPAPKAKLNAYFRLLGSETEHMEAHVRPRRKPRILRLIDEACRRAIQALERERLNQYSEAAHRMIFPRAAGFSSVPELHTGEVFQRALILEALLDAQRAGYSVNGNGITDDVARLAGMRSPDGLRGWKYFPSLPELPPDADDLAQVMQVLARVAYPGMRDVIDPLLRGLEESNVNSDGSFETWIVDLHDESPASLLVKEFIRTHWGAGPNPEVIANLLYALWIYHRDRYQKLIDGAIGYLSSSQLPNGSWPAGWYAGSNYSTFVCVRAFRNIDPSHYGLYRATQFLLQAQHGAGGWGSPEPNAGDTAYSLRTACLLSNEVAHKLISPACHFLFERQQADGFWPASDFITMDTARARGGSPGQTIVYRSKTITTAACLSALCAARPLAEQE